MSVNRPDKHTRYHLAGWILFVICALLFLYVAVRDSNLVMTLASLVFLAGCVAFLIPLLFPATSYKETSSTDKNISPEKKE